MKPSPRLIGIKDIIINNFRYIPELGLLERVVPAQPGKPCLGVVRGHVQRNGYVHICINNHAYKYHRVIFLHQNGHLPDYLDHIDRNRSNNRIENLRESSASLNMGNRPKTVGHTRYKGVSSIVKPDGTRVFIAQIVRNYKHSTLGCFEDQESAARAYDEKAKEFFGDHAFLNFN